MTSWIFRLLCLCGTLTSVLCCDWLTNYGHLSNKSLTLLQLMGGQLLDQDCPVPFPYRLYDRIKKDEVASQLLFVRDSLQLLAALYQHHNRSATNWDADKTDRFLMILDRQTDELNSCVSTNRTAGSRLEKYYRRLENSTLIRTGGSTASWELIRSQSVRHLQQLELLLAVIRDHQNSAASRRRSAASRRPSAASRRRSAASRRRSVVSRRRSAASRRRSAASRRRSAMTRPHKH
ncbi:interferon phi 1 [Centropristis striata]|uniref:interferon phi 1 n=1 Tax=Centropristis striata TaxID=184440 RepID=UPI0027DF0487|nr:interferon phi 1 [Centropristis striata]